MASAELVIVYPKRLVVPDGDPCDRCPRVLGHHGRYVRVDGRTMQLCSSCVTVVCRDARDVVRER